MTNNLSFAKKLSRLSTGLTNAGTISSGSSLETSISSIAGGGVTVYNTIDDLPLSGNSAGDQAFVDSDNRLYIHTGEGWYSIALINTSPSITSGYNSNYDLALDGTATVITLIGSDPEGIPITWSYTTTGLDSEATISQSSNVFTVTPNTNTEKGGTFSITFTASDGVNIGTAASSFTLSFGDGQIMYVHKLVQGDDSTYITDASDNSLALTESGDVRPSAFSPVKGGYYSNYFDGTGDYLSTASDTAFQLGTSNFTIECWVYLNTLNANTTILRMAAGNGTDGILFGHSSSGLVYATSAGGSWDIIGGSTLTGLTTNTWQHLALTRDGSTFRGFVDGAVVFTVTSSSSIYQSSAIARIGAANSDGSYAMNGYLSNLRIVKGTALYTSAFTPSTSPLTTTSQSATASEVSLLTCQSSRFIDNSTNGYTLTVNGDTSIKAFNPFAANSDYASYGSAYFDGTGDYLSVADNDSLDGFTGNFTLEYWVNFTSTSVGAPLAKGWLNGGTYSPYLFNINANRLLFYAASNANSGWDINSGVVVINPLVTNQWYHIALVRSGSSNTIYVNGTAAASYTSSATYLNSTSPLTIGSADGGYNTMTGYISNVRIVKGTALYTADFTPSTSPLTTTSQGATASEVSLLTLQYNKPANNKKVVDKTGISTVTVNGDTYTGSFTPYTTFGHSVYFDGSGDYLTVPSSSSFNLGTGAWTIEGWFSTNARTGDMRFVTIEGSHTLGIICGGGGSGGSTNDLVVNQFGSGDRIRASNVLVNGSWNAIALVYDGTNTKLYLNGTQVGSAYNANVMPNSNCSVTIGASVSYSQQDYNGHISNLRIVKGAALYTAAYTPSTTALTPTEKTVLLTCQSPSIEDKGPYRHTITKYNDAKVISSSPFAPHTVAPNTHSVYFDGTGDYLMLAANSDFVLSGDFTIEAWVWTTTTSGDHGIISMTWSSSSGSNGLALYLGGSNIDFWVAGNGSNVQGSTTITTNEWHHVALVRNGSTNTLYIDGTSESTSTTTPNFPSTPLIGIGRYYNDNGSYLWDGYISNVRIVDGTALYTSAFTPSTSPLTTTSQGATASEVALLTCQDSTLVDNSTNALAITGYNDVQPVEFNPLGYTNTTLVAYNPTTHGGSAYFDGSGDYLSIPYNESFATGTGDFTVESWFYLNSLASGYYVLGGNWNNGATDEWLIQIQNNGNIRFLTNGGGTFYTGGITTGRWYHFAAVRASGTITVYLNGSSIGSFSDSNTLYSTSKTTYIGTQQTTSWPWNGYISNFRFVNGTALYTSNFVPPKQSTPVANEVISLPFNDAAIYDATTTQNLKTVGDARVSSAFKKYGSGSIYCDGNGDTVSGYLAAPIGSGDFTIEAWSYTMTQLIAGIFTVGQWNTSGGVALISYSNSGSYAWSIGVNNYTTNAGTLIFDEWFHWAITRSGTSAKLWINGSNVHSTTSSENLTLTYFQIYQEPAGWNAMQGYMDDLRITRGVARYTSTFTPPARHLAR